jgi:tetratricopeptide (TPR) repeat protein/ribosomal protein S18 acetylase RimI-like enzyme
MVSIRMPMVKVRKATVEDAPAIAKLAESLRLRPPDVDKGFLVHVRTQEQYRRILEVGERSLVAVDDEGAVEGGIDGAGNGKTATDGGKAASESGNPPPAEAGGVTRSAPPPIPPGAEAPGVPANFVKGRVVGFLLAYTYAELSVLMKDALKGDAVIESISNLGELTMLYADQIGVEVACRKKGVGQALASELMGANKGAHHFAAIMHKPFRNERSISLATRNGWTLRNEVPEGDFIWGIYEFKDAAGKGAQLEDALVQALFVKAGQAQHTGRREEALELYDKLIGLNPRIKEAWNNRGLVLYGLWRYEEAAVAFDKALELDPKYWESLFNKANTLAELGRTEEAIDYYNRALSVNPKDRMTWFAKATRLCTLERYEEAIPACNRVLELDPKEVSIWNLKGMALMVTGRTEEAVACFDEALRLAPNNKESLNDRAKALSDLGRHHEALESIDRALKLQPDDSSIWYNKGNLLMDMEDYLEATSAFEMALSLDPKRANAWNNKGLCLYYMGRFREAVDCYDRAVALDPYFETAKENRDKAREMLDGE